MRVKLTAAALVFYSSTLSYAAPSCSSLLAGAEETTVASNPLEALQEQIDQAKSLKEASELTYDKVAMGNNILDQAIDGIIHLNTQPAQNPQVANQQALQVQIMIEALQNAFGIPSYIMGFAISNRLEIESAESLKVLKAEQERVAIGFNRNEAALDFHKDPPVNNPIGFVITQKTQEKKKSGSLFFQTLIDSLKTKTPNETAENAAPRTPIGFVHPKQESETENSKPLDQMGFAIANKSQDYFNPSDLPEIVLNVKNGEFRIENDPVKQPIGFINTTD